MLLIQGENIDLDPDAIGKRGVLSAKAIAVGGAGGKTANDNGKKTCCNKPTSHGTISP